MGELPLSMLPIQRTATDLRKPLLLAAVVFLAQLPFAQPLDPGMPLITALLVGAGPGLAYVLFEHAGDTRAVAGGLAFALTPAVLASNAPDVTWGAVFLLAALVALRRNVWVAAVFLGLATAAQPVYLLALLTLWLLVWTWRQMLLLVAGAAAGAAVAYIFPGLWHPAMGVVEVFGIVGGLGVVVAAVSAFRRKLGPPDAFDLCLASQALIWAVCAAALGDAAYLIPALAGLYWLICKFAHRTLLWTMVAALAVSSLWSYQTRSGTASGEAIRADKSAAPNSMLAMYTTSVEDWLFR